MYSTITAFTLIGTILCAPQQYSTPYPSQPNPSQYTTPIPIVSQKQEQNLDGSYVYSYQTGNGIAAEEQGVIKNAGQEEINSVQGYFAYPGLDGVQYSVSYTADERGFLPQGAHLPTPPPIPEALLKAIAAVPKDDTQYDDRGFPIKGGAPTAGFAPAPQPAYQPRPQPSFQLQQPTNSYPSNPSVLGAPVQGFGGRS